jgi:hypothetical protein
MKSLEFGRTRLTEVDKDLAEYLRFVQKFPRTTVKRLEAGE